MAIKLYRSSLKAKTGGAGHLLNFPDIQSKTMPVRRLLARCYARSKAQLPTPSTALCQALRQLRSESPHFYAKIFIHNFPFTVAHNDVIKVHRIKDAQVGDVLRLWQVREIGSKSFTLRGTPLLNDQLIEVRAAVIEHGRGAKVSAAPRKQRKGRRPVKNIKPHITALRINSICINEALIQ